MICEERARLDLVYYCGLVQERGWVANHDGNLSVRVGENRIVTTPTAVPKGQVSPEMLIVVDLAGNKVEGTRKPFSELALHLHAYRSRPDVLAVLHAHPPTTSGFALAGVEIDPGCMPEAVVSLGDRIPLVPFALPFGEDGARPFAPFWDDYDVFLMERHGALSLGADLPMAFLRMELLDHLARIQLVARQLGSVSRMSGTHIQALLERRRAAGLGPEARGKTPPTGSAGDAGSRVSPQEDGPAPSAWTGGYLVGPCSGEKILPADSEQLQRTEQTLPTEQDLQALLLREVQRVLGRT